MNTTEFQSKRKNIAPPTLTTVANTVRSASASIDGEPARELIDNRVVGARKSLPQRFFDAVVTRFLRSRFQHIVKGFEEGRLRVQWPDGSETLLGSETGAFATAVEANHITSVIDEQVAQQSRVEVVMRDFDPMKRMALHGSIGWAESYMDGHWETNDIFGLFMLFLHNEKHFPTAVDGSWPTRLKNIVRHRHNKNTLRGSRRNIAQHYDLGNDFYRLWLDQSMSYSSAWYQSEKESLEQAQQNKIDKVLEILNVKPGSKVLEIGCGWGAMGASINAISSCSVTGISLSNEQLEYARNQYGGVASKETDSPLEYRYCDYREMNGLFDHIVSIEMFEAVGREYWSAYFSKLNELLVDNGTAVLQVITIAEDRYEEYARQPDFIQKYIFPGGMLATKTQLHTLAATHDLEVTSIDYFGSSYARTLKEWRMRFEDRIDAVREQGFDERFIRMWRYYLAYCEAGFTIGSTDVGLWNLRKRPA